MECETTKKLESNLEAQKAENVKENVGLPDVQFRGTEK